MHFRIATYNIHRCVGRDGKKNLTRIARVLREINADIIALQEVTSQPEIADDILASLAAVTGMEPIEGFTLTTTGARYGNALLSKFPVSAIQRYDISVKGREPRGVIQAKLNINDQTVILWATHLGLGIRERYLQAEKLLKTVDGIESDLSVLLGDFNEWLSWSRLLRGIGKKFTNRHSPATFPSHRPLLKLDRIWVRPVDKLSTLRAHSTELSRVASDHLPLVADITF